MLPEGFELVGRNGDLGLEDRVAVEFGDGLGAQGLHQQGDGRGEDALAVGVDLPEHVLGEGVEVQDREQMPAVVHDGEHLEVSLVEDLEGLPQRHVAGHRRGPAAHVVFHLRDELGHELGGGHAEALQDVLRLEVHVAAPGGKTVRNPQGLLELGVGDGRHDGVRVGVAVAEDEDSLFSFHREKVPLDPVVSACPLQIGRGA